MHCRDIYCLLQVVVKGPGSFEHRSPFLYDVRLRSYGASKLPNFRILAYFPHTKPLKRTFRWPAYSPGVISQNDSDFSMVVVEVPKGCLPAAKFSCDFWCLGIHKRAQIFVYGNWLYPYRMQLHGASDLDQRCLKTRNSKDGCTFPPNIFVPTLKITPKPHFGGPFNAKPITQVAVRKSHVNGAIRRWNFTAIGIRKYLGVCQNLSATGASGAEGPLM